MILTDDQGRPTPLVDVTWAVTLPQPMILTDNNGRPLARPQRAEFPADIEGTISYVRAHHAYRDSIAQVANTAFHRVFWGTQRGHTSRTGQKPRVNGTG